MNERIIDRIGPACGILYVVLEIGGLLIGVAGGKATMTLANTPNEVMNALDSPAGTGVWVGAYLEMLSILAFLGFAAWAVTRLGDGVLAVAARGAAWSYASVSVLSLCVWDAVELRAGHGMGAQLAAALANVGEATFVGTWFLSAGFMLAVGALALAQRRRLLGWSGIAFAAVILAACAAPVSDTGQMAASLPWFVWIVAASIALARRPRVRAAVPATA